MKTSLKIRETGNISLVALIFMVILSTMALVLYNNSSHSYTLHREQMLKVQALNLAATAISSAEKIVIQEELWSGVSFGQNFGEHSAEVELLIQGNNKSIQWFSATVRFPEYKIQLVRSKVHLIGGRAHDVYKYDLYAKNNLTIATGVQADQVKIAGNGVVQNKSPLVIVQENVAIVLPIFKRSDYNNYSTYLPLGNSLAQGFDGRVMGKTYEPNFTLREYAVLLGSGVIINSNIRIGKNCQILGIWHLISEQDIVISDNCKLNNVLLFAKGDVIMNDNVSFSGVIIAGRNIKIGDNCNIKIATEDLSMITSSVYSS